MKKFKKEATILEEKNIKSEVVIEESTNKGFILLRPLFAFWKWLDNLHIFEKFIRLRWGLMAWGAAGIVGAFVIFIFVVPLINENIKTYTIDKKTREKNLKRDLEKAAKYDKIEKENKFLKGIREKQVFDVYQHNLFMLLYDYYKNHGTLQKWYWINTSVFREVYDASVKSMNLCPSFAESYFRMFPGEREYFRNKIRKQHSEDDISAKKYEELVKEEENKYIKFIFPLHDYAKCKRESNFDPKCKSYNYKREKAGIHKGWYMFTDSSGRHARRDTADRAIFYVIDKMSVYDKDTNGDWKKYKAAEIGPMLIVDSIDYGIEQMNTICIPGGNKEVAKARPYLAGRDIFDIEKNICMRTLHTQDLIKNKQEWFLVDQDFFWMLRNFMWKHYYPDMSEFVGY